MRTSHGAAGFAAVLIMLGSSSVKAEVLIGVGAPLTGQMAWHGEDEERGIQMAISEISAAGGFLG
jgi:branched-chain amino acid transport system substrate-binding protein